MAAAGLAHGCPSVAACRQYDAAFEGGVYHAVNCSGLAQLGDIPCGIPPNTTFSLDLAGNSMMALAGGMFAGLRIVAPAAAINLSGNCISNVPPVAFDGFAFSTDTTVSLDLSGNCITTVQTNAFKALVGNILIDLSSNDITDLQPEAFSRRGWQA